MILEPEDISRARMFTFGLGTAFLAAGAGVLWGLGWSLIIIGGGIIIFGLVIEFARRNLSAIAVNETPTQPHIMEV